MELSEPEVTFCRKLQNGPSILFLGQAYLRDAKGQDHFLAQILKHAGPRTATSNDYSELLDMYPASDAESIVAWMSDLARRTATPQWLQTISDYPWSAVYSSAIDSTWARAFDNGWRKHAPVVLQSHRPANPRNRRELHCTFLYGSTDRTVESGGAPPLTYDSYLARRAVAAAFLGRLLEDATPLGTLAIEGYDLRYDWLTPDDLGPIVTRSEPNQIHLFSTTKDEVAQYRGLRNHVTSGKLVVHTRPLAEILIAGHAAGIINLNDIPTEEESGQRISLNGKSHFIPRRLWNDTAKSGTLITTSILQQPPDASPEQLYQEYREFLATSDTRPRWTAYAPNRAFPFQRDFERKLHQRTKDRLTRDVTSERPIIVHGDTGSGKTVALGRLAYEIGLAGEAAVIFIDRTMKKPYPDDLEPLCRWSQTNGAICSVIVWDGMQDPEDYSELLQALRGKGLKVVLIGSSYKLSDDASRRGVTSILASSHIDEINERPALQHYLQRFDPSFGQLAEEGSKFLDNTFLVALYRLLPATRVPISQGVLRQYDRDEDRIKILARSGTLSSRHLTTLELALFHAGIDERLNELENSTSPEPLSLDSRLLTSLIIVPGQFGLPVPLELLMRAMERIGFTIFLESARELGIFEWSEDAQGHISVSTRNKTEAEILARARIGGAGAEAEIIARLITEVKVTGPAGSSNQDVRFAAELLRAIGPRGDHRSYFVNWYPTIAKGLTRLREDRSQEHPRLMLQESVLLRHWAKSASFDHFHKDRSNVDFDEVTSAFLAALEAAQRALSMKESGWVNPDLELQLHNELASCLASMAIHQGQLNGDRIESLRLFDESQLHVSQARHINPTNFYPIDVMRWSTKDMIELHILDGEREFHARATLMDAFLAIDPMLLDSVQRQHYYELAPGVFSWQGLTEHSNRAFENLVAAYPASARYLRAIQLAGGADFFESRKGVNHEQLVRNREALEYLAAHRSDISGDTRCLDLELTLWWSTKAGHWPLAADHETVPFRAEDWETVLRLVDDIVNRGDSHRPHAVKLLRGLCEFHLGRFTQCFETFEEIRTAHDYMLRGNIRRQRFYLASDSSGHAMVYSGIASWIGSGGYRGGQPEGEVFVEEIRRNVRFLPIEFGNPGVEDRLEDFHITFGFRGLIAEPAQRLVSK